MAVCKTAEVAGIILMTKRNFFVLLISNFEFMQHNEHHYTNVLRIDFHKQAVGRLEAKKHCLDKALSGLERH